MIGLASIAVGALLAAGIYSMLARGAQRVAIGFLLVSNGVNLLVLTASGMPEAASPPLVRGGAPPSPAADPLAQAFILTAIVIGFGMAAFLLGMSVDVERASKHDEPAGGDGP